MKWFSVTHPVTHPDRLVKLKGLKLFIHGRLDFGTHFLVQTLILLWIVGICTNCSFIIINYGPFLHDVESENVAYSSKFSCSKVKSIIIRCCCTIIMVKIPNSHCVASREGTAKNILVFLTWEINRTFTTGLKLGLYKNAQDPPNSYIFMKQIYFISTENL